MRFLADLISRAFDFFFTLTGSAGWTFIIITLLARFLLSPLTRWSSRSMLKMRELAPQAEALRRRSKEDPTRLRRELADLSKRSGISPWTPMVAGLLQFLLFIALSRALWSPGHFRGQTFLGIPLDQAPCPGTLLPDLDCVLQLIQNPFLTLLPVLVTVTAHAAARSVPIDSRHNWWTALLAIVWGLLGLSLPAWISVFWIVWEGVQTIEYGAARQAQTRSLGLHEH